MKDQEKRQAITNKRISPTQHESIACLESSKQHAFMCPGTRPPTAFV